MKSGMYRSVLCVLIISATALVFPFSAFGKGKLVFIPLNEKGKAMVALKEMPESVIRLSLQNESGDNIYQTIFTNTSGNYRKVFNLSRLTDGSYNLVVKTENETLTREFVIENSLIRVIKQEPGLPPLFKMNDDHIILLFTSTEGNGANINFSNREGLIYTEYCGTTPVRKYYDLKELPDGPYEITLASGNYVYTYNFVIDR